MHEHNTQQGYTSNCNREMSGKYRVGAYLLISHGSVFLDFVPKKLTFVGRSISHTTAGTTIRQGALDSQTKLMSSLRLFIVAKNVP